jgi:hypothetical protein
MLVGLHVNCPLFLSDLIQRELSRQIFKQPTDMLIKEQQIHQLSFNAFAGLLLTLTKTKKRMYFMKIQPVGTEFSHADGHT